MPGSFVVDSLKTDVRISKQSRRDTSSVANHRHRQGMDRLAL